MIEVSKLHKMLKLEAATAKQGSALSSVEKVAYLAAFPTSKFVATSAVSHGKWFSSLSPKQQKEYLQLHPNSKMKGGASKAPAAKTGPDPSVAWNAGAHKVMDALGNISGRLQSHSSHIQHLTKAARMASKAEDLSEAGKHTAASAMLGKLHTHLKALPKVPTTVAKNKEDAPHVKNMQASAGEQLDAASEEPDVGQMGMLLHDAADHLHIGRHLAKGKHNSAIDHANSMDTAARDEINNSTYDHLMKRLIQATKTKLSSLR
jgi:hypothetical protein